MPVDRQSETVLLVEDEEPLRRLVDRVLTAAGYSVTVASRPAEAFDLLREAGGRVDLVVSDVAMPGMDGCEMLEEMRAEWPSLRVLFLSASAGGVRLSERFSGQQVAFLPKPFGLQQLLQGVRETLDTAPVASR